MSHDVPTKADRIRHTLSAARWTESSFARNSVVLITLNGASIILSGLTAILLARVLGPEQLGYLVLFSTGTATMTLFADILGIYYSNAYLLASGRSRVTLPTVTGTVLAYGAAVGLAVGMAVGLTPLRDALFPGLIDWRWGALLVLGVFGLAVTTQIKSIFLGQSNFLGLGLMGITQASLYSILGVGVAYGFAWRTGLQIAAIQVASICISALIYLRLLSRSGIGRPEIAYVLTLSRVGLRAAVANWLGFLQLRVDQLLVNFVLGRVALGSYSVAVSLGELLTRVPAMMGTVVFPLAAESTIPSTMARSTLRRSALVMAVVALLSIPIAAFADTIVTALYGVGFVFSVQPLRVLLPGMIFMAGLLIIDNHLAGLGYPMMKIVALAVSLGINILGNLILLPRFGIIGASLTSSVSYLIWLGMVGGYLWQLSRSPAES